MKRRLIPAAALVAPLVLAPLLAQAGIPVFDVANFGQTLSTALSTAEHVRQMVQQLRNMEQQLRNQAQTLRSLDPRSFQGLLDSISTITMAKNTLLAQVDAISFSGQQVNADFQRLFPRGSREWADVHSSSFATRRADWNSELTASSLVAMRAQTNLDRIGQADLAAQRILVTAQGADGEVRQLQGITQMLAVIQTQMTQLVQILSTGSRVTADQAAAAAGNDTLTQEARKRRAAGYSDMGPPPMRLQRLP